MHSFLFKKIHEDGMPMPDVRWHADARRCEGTANPLQAWTRPEGSGRLRIPELSALRTGRLYPHEIFLVLISVEVRWFDSRWCHWNFSLT